MLHKRCNTDMLGVLLIYNIRTLPWALRPRDRAYISVKPLTAMLQPINIYILYTSCAYPPCGYVNA